jgi:hypothetical protein
LLDSQGNSGYDFLDKEMTMLEFLFGSVIVLLLLGGVLGAAVCALAHVAHGAIVCVVAVFLLLRSLVTGKPVASPKE